MTPEDFYKALKELYRGVYTAGHSGEGTFPYPDPLPAGA